MSDYKLPGHDETMQNLARLNQTDPLDEVRGILSDFYQSIQEQESSNNPDFDSVYLVALTALNAEIAKAVDEAVKKEQERCKAILKLKLGL